MSFLGKILLNVLVIRKEELKIFRNISKCWPWSSFFTLVTLLFSYSRWFEGFSWECLQKGTLIAPYIPKVFVSDWLSFFFVHQCFWFTFRLNTMVIHRTLIHLVKMMLVNQLMIWLVGTKNFNQKEWEDRPAQSPLCIRPLLFSKFQTMNKCALYRRSILNVLLWLAHAAGAMKNVLFISLRHSKKPEPICNDNSVMKCESLTRWMINEHVAFVRWVKSV